MSDLNEIECGQLCQTTIESLYKATGSLSNFPGLLKKIIVNKAWERRVSKGKVIELASLRELITAKPIKGWGEDPKKVEAIIKDDAEVLSLFRDAMKGQEGGDTTCNNITGAAAKTGTSRAYSIDRVQRECDSDTVEKVMSGAMSPNAALVASGLRENRQVYVPREPAKAVEKLRRQFGDAFVKAMADVITKEPT